MYKKSSLEIKNNKSDEKIFSISCEKDIWRISISNMQQFKYIWKKMIKPLNEALAGGLKDEEILDMIYVLKTKFRKYSILNEKPS